MKYEFLYNNANHTYYIPKNVFELFDNEFSYREIANWQEMQDVVLKFYAPLEP